MKEIYLKEILFKEVNKFREKYNPINLYTNKEMENSVEFKFFIAAMKEACKQTLELAAEKVSDSRLGLNYYNQNEQMQRKIRNIISQIK